MDKIRELTNQAKPQAGCGVGDEDDLSFTHSNLHRARKEGSGHLALLVPSQLPYPFFAVIMDGQLMCDSLQSDIPTEVAEDCRSAARDIPTKMQLSSMSNQNLDVLVRRIMNQYMTSKKILSPILREIYDGQAMPWLSRDERDRVMSHFLREGNGLAALFPKGKKHLLKAVTSRAHRSQTDALPYHSATGISIPC